ncbi:MAG TPA: hypothetical protein VL282_01955 [Tepidisphaeraceae bacterium]|jgi:hypothetical protein|nr:hypothetical protein [Tepidisphaeraceae bacterium]
MAHSGRKLAEQVRLEEDASRAKNWKRWGPYLSERQWATVREDYSADGDAWSYFPHEHARSRAYRWGEDGLLGICDRECRLCFALALWNGRDRILKERLYGVTGPEGNHGEDVKELYYYLDSSPTHSYLKGLYKYPQAEYPYELLHNESTKRNRKQAEFEITDTGIFNDNRYFDVFVEYAKADPDDILIRVRVANRGPERAPLHLIPTLWFRNGWTWGCTHEGCETKPWMRRAGQGSVDLTHPSLGKWRFEIEPAKGYSAPELLFTENETNLVRLYGVAHNGGYVKDAFDHYIVHGRDGAVNPQQVGTKLGVLYLLDVPAGGSITVNMRLFPTDQKPAHVFGASFEETFKQRIAETDDFYRELLPKKMPAEQRNIARQAYAGLLWSKQFYHYVIKDWLEGDPNLPPPPPERKQGRNSDWGHLFNRDVISMPDKWEYPWYAAWDLAFHMLPMAQIDAKFAKDQLILLLREWYMHPNGELPAYEWAFGDVNPPVHAWACWRVYKISGRRGHRDRMFLQRVFHKLLLNFTWWINRKDVRGKHLFAGGFLGLDNIGLFDRSASIRDGVSLEQADGTSWVAFFCATMLAIALELASEDPAYEDIASKFFEHFVAIIDAMNGLGGTGLWNEADGFYYDQLLIDGRAEPLRVRSMVGIIPLFACEILEKDVIDRLPGFSKRMNWFIKHRPDLSRHITFAEAKPNGDSHAHLLLAVPPRDRLERMLRYVLDETEFLSPYGIRSLSRYHEDNPVIFKFDGRELRAKYAPAESDTDLFGGNSNWRGPVWFPLNYLLIEALERYHHFYGDSLKVECPVGSGNWLNLSQTARELETRLTRLFIADSTGQRPIYGKDRRWADDANFKRLLQFYEYFDGDNGRGCGASHQTGWTSLITRCLEDLAGSAVGDDDRASLQSSRRVLETETSGAHDG